MLFLGSMYLEGWSSLTGIAEFDRIRRLFSCDLERLIPAGASEEARI